MCTICMINGQSGWTLRIQSVVLESDQIKFKTKKKAKFYQIYIQLFKEKHALIIHVGLDILWKFEWTSTKPLNFINWSWFFGQRLTKVTKFQVFMKWTKKNVYTSITTYFSFWHFGCKTNWTGHLTYYVRVMDSIWKKVCICPDNVQYMVRSDGDSYSHTNDDGKRAQNCFYSKPSLSIQGVLQENCIDFSFKLHFCECSVPYLSALTTGNPGIHESVITKDPYPARIQIH